MKPMASHMHPKLMFTGCSKVAAIHVFPGRIQFHFLCMCMTSEISPMTRGYLGPMVSFMDLVPLKNIEEFLTCSRSGPILARGIIDPKKTPDLIHKSYMST